MPSRSWIIPVICLLLYVQKEIRVKSEETEQTLNTTSIPDEDDDWEEDDSTEIDDDGRIYKNPRNSPSTLCPRDEDQATLLGQKCLRKCSSDEDCKSKKKKCLCDGACGMSCIKPDRECPEHEQIQFGSVTSSGRLFGARITYTCIHGYHVVGLQSRTCQADGQWAGAPPACKQNIYCLSPPTIDHARHNALSEQTTFDLDFTLQYYCHTGYVTNGFPRAKCLAIDGQASWYGPDISCEPRSCGPPIDISHGWHAGECYTYGCHINYHCAESFELVGRNEYYCQADGTWMPKELPTCVLVTAVQCPTPENPRHGKAIYTSCSYNSIVSYECKYGYTLVGETTRRCGADKKWSGSQPICKEINCGHPGRLWNGWLENIEGGTGLGASIIFRCHEGMRLEGNSSTVCQVDAKWRYPVPKCLAPCVVPQVSQGRVSLIYRNDTTPSSTVVQDGEALTVDCDPYYEFFLSHAPVECNNGTWTHIPKCQPARCKHLPKPPKNGMIIAPKMEHGMRARFKCKDGFELRGNNLIECSFGNWTGEFPICQEVFCPFPGLVENGKILLVGNMGLYDYRPYVKKVSNNKQIMYDCDKGYVLSEGPPGATCVGGSWSPRELPKCTLGQHPRLRWSRKKRYIAIKRYKRIHLNQWWTYLKYLFVNSTQINEEHKDINRVKRALKTGSGSSSSRVLGTGLKTSKSQPSSRRGKDRHALEDTNLDRKKYCIPLTEESFANISVIKPGHDPTASYSSGTVIQVLCEEGYSVNLPNKNSTIKCVRGKWRPVKPKCLHAPCELPKILEGEYLSGYYAGFIIENGSNITYSCSQKIRSTVFCVAGQFQPEEPTCDNSLAGIDSINSSFLGGADIVKSGKLVAKINKLPCGLPERTEGSLTYHTGESILTSIEDAFPHDTSVTFDCIENIIGEKTTWKIICENGSWIGRAVKCESDVELSLIRYERKMNASCLFKNQDPNLVTFMDDQEVGDGILEFSNGTQLISRCADIGKFAITGLNKRTCKNTEWDSPFPFCTGLNQENDYSMQKPPTILFRYESGPIAQSNEGKLIVYPGANLHMECLWMRRFGVPKWSVSHENRQYPQNWTSDPGRDSALEFRLSIIHATKEDSGLYTCLTPTRYTHAIDVDVRAVHCPEIPQRRGLTINTQETKMNTVVVFACTNENTIVGAAEVTCLPSGNWSSIFPLCESIECGEVGVLPAHLNVTILSREIGGRAVYNCSSGYSIDGPKETTCQSNGKWATALPKCKEVQCATPEIPEHGYIQGTGPYKAGDIIQYSCNSDFMMDGQPIIACQDNGRWSGTVPKCAQACPYPGTIISGQMAPVKFYYKIGENITFNCEDNLSLSGASMIKCLRYGKWSNSIPTCELRSLTNTF